MKRISKKTRDEAILICAIAASGGVQTFGEMPNSYAYGEIRAALGIMQGSGSCDLAIDAWLAVRGFQGSSWTRDTDAAAECLLRDGWSPGDPVEMLFSAIVELRRHRAVVKRLEELIATLESSVGLGNPHLIADEIRNRMRGE